MLDCVKMLMEINRVEQNRLARWMDCSQNNISVMLKRDDIKCGRAAEVLDFMGYEIIVREKGGKRRQDEILIDNGEDGLDPRKILILRDEQLKAEEKERYYAGVEAELRAKYPYGMRMKDLCEFFSRNNPLIHKYFDGYIYRGRVSIDNVARIMREHNL